MTTTLLAVAIALGPVTGVVPVAVLSVLWFVAVAYVIMVLLVAKRRWSISHWVFVVGVGAAASACILLGIIQLVEGRQALFWNVDWRYHVTQAYGIARFGGLSDSLDYAGLGRSSTTRARSGSPGACTARSVHRSTSCCSCWCRSPACS